MTEQETKKKKRGPILLKPGERNTAYDNPKLREKIIELRTDGKTWEEISDKISSEFDVNPNSTYVSKIYHNEISKSITVDKPAKDMFEKHRLELDKRYARVVKITDWLLEAIEKVRDEFNSSDMEDIQKYLAFIKMTPHILATSKAVLEQLDFIKQENEKIKLEQKNHIWSATQVNQHLYSTLQMLNKEGYIKILKKLPTDSNRDERRE
jgi:proline dehydrogenase